jgi:hypothetical protein
MRLENIGYVYPFYVYGSNRPLAPVLRQDGAVWFMMFIDLLDESCCDVTGSKYLEYIPESELNNLQDEQWNEQWNKKRIE